VTRPACDGRFITVVGSAVRPGSYPTDVARLLRRHSGSAYLFAEASCSSLRARLPDGNSIYAVYLGPFATQAQACATRRTVGGDSYVRVLDDVTPAGRVVQC
jgi:serine/threonine-protein kinase